MNEMNGAPPWRCLVVAATATAALAALVAVLLPDLLACRDSLVSGHLATASFTDLLEWWCAACALAAATWLWVGTLALAASVARGAARPAARPVWPTRTSLPSAVRRVVLLACGATLGAGLAVPAQAAGDHHVPPAGASAAARLQGLPLPDRATGRGPRPPVAARAAVAALPAPAHRLTSVVVHPGDSLWTLAQHALPGPATAEAVSRRWQQVYALNRGVVGPDPDLIEPGQRLRLPHA